MNNQEAIKIIRIALAQVEWECPTDYSVAFDMAVSALEKPEPKVRIEIDGKTYASDKPILKAVHGTTGEVTVGNFYEVKNGR
jgi:hypothetical protein